MNILMVTMRLIHILSSMVWIGGSIMMTAFIGPSAKKVGPDAGKMMQQLTLRSPFANTMALVAILTAGSGLTMYWYLFRGINTQSTPGLMLTIGGITGLIAFAMGFLTQRSNTVKMIAIADEIAAAGGPPTPEQMTTLGVLQESQAKAGALLTLILVLTLIFMTLSEQI